MCLSQVAVGARCSTTARILAAKGRTIAGDVAQFGRSALGSGMSPFAGHLRVGQGSRGLIRFRQAAVRIRPPSDTTTLGLSVLSLGAGRKDHRS